MRWVILAVVAWGTFPSPAYADRNAALKLYEELVAERKRAHSELRDIERVRKDESAFRAQLAIYEDSMKILDTALPEAPRAEEWQSEMEKYARSCGAGLVAYEPSEIEHDRYRELRYPLEMTGDASVECLGVRLRTRPRISGWTDRGRSDDGKVLADVSVFYAPASDGALLPCREFDHAAVKDAGRHLSEFERVILESTFTELQKTCREIEASPEERHLIKRDDDLAARVKLVHELQTLYKP